MLKRSAVFASLLLLACGSLIDTDDGSLKLIASASAGNGNGKANGNSSGSESGVGNGNAADNPGNANSAGKGGSADQEFGGKSIGDDFRNEGFAPSGDAAATLPLKSRNGEDSTFEGDVLHRDDLPAGYPDNEVRAPYDLGFGNQFSLDFLKNGAGNATELAKHRDAEAAVKDERDDQLSGKALRHLKAEEMKPERTLNGKTFREEHANDGLALREGMKSSGGQSAGRGPSARRNDGQVDARISTPTASYMPREILSINLSSASLSRIRALGFQPSPSPTEADDSLTMLIAPEALGAPEALELLRRELPADRFQLNRVYRTYRLAAKDDSGAGESTEPARLQPGRACVEDRCYGRAAIRWVDEFARCARGITVGVIDTDVDLAHPAFAGQNIARMQFLRDDKRPAPPAHGTGILALLAGRPDSGTPGLIHEATFLSASVFFANDGGEPVTDTLSLLKALDWLRGSRARLINMSFAGPRDDLIGERIKAMRAEGFVFVAAVGNEGPAAAPAYPAAYPEVIAVTAVGKNLKLYPFANRGPQTDLAAPGVRIWTALPNARAGYQSGTSFAVPFATAVLALQPQNVLSAPKQDLLRHVQTVGLGATRADSGYRLLQAPANCPGIIDRTSTSAAPAARY
jgi:hypothetical protein